ncbi:MAG: SurA N-terminal domain-containing protein [Bacteroidetes bacterium]|nr:SurA N-terminal domain-containing protein [Bacteroidota bacterium]
MTILSSIRSRVGLLVGIIFLALLSFVLTDLFNSQRGLFGGSGGDNSVGVINGHTITINEYRAKLDEYSAGKTLTEQEQSQLSDGIWQEMIDKYIFEPQYSTLGITVTDDELAEQMYGDHPSSYMNQFFQDRQTGQVNPQFAGADGTLSGQKIRDFVKKMPAETEVQWAQIERDMRKYLLHEKYNTLLRKGFYVTSSEAKHEYADENTKYNFKFIVKKFSEIGDSTIKCTDAELTDYYNANQVKFKQADNMRSMEYVAFDVFPSADDIASQRKDMENLVSEFKSKKAVEDSAYVVAMNESGTYAKTYLHPGQFPAGSDSSFLKASIGDVLGPFSTGENISLYKVLGQKTSVDSCKVRHILITYKGGERAAPEITRSKIQAKAKADSILRVVKSGRTKMEDIVEKLTDDPGSKSGNKGDYGWFTPESGFVKEFKDAGFNNAKGATVVVETSFGYHVIQVIDKSEASAKVQVVAIDKKVEPSESTIRSVYNKASEFAGRNITGEAFDAAVKKDNMQVLKADQVLENTKSISGIDNPKEITRWMYDNKTIVGTVSQPFQSTNRYLVCNLTKILNKGFKPFNDESVQEICLLEVRKQKKAQQFIDELNKQKGTSIDQWGANAKIPVQPGANVTFAAPYMQGAGYEGAVVGTLATLAPGKLSAPIKGTMGVYVVQLESVQKPAPITDLKSKQIQLIQGMASRADQTAADILKDKADVTDNRAKHF